MSRKLKHADIKVNDEVTDFYDSIADQICRFDDVKDTPTINPNKCGPHF